MNELAACTQINPLRASICLILDDDAFCDLLVKNLNNVDFAIEKDGFLFHKTPELFFLDTWNEKRVIIPKKSEYKDLFTRLCNEPIEEVLSIFS